MIGLVLLVGSILLSNAEDDPSRAPENFVKASIVYNLETYIYWPTQMTKGPITIAVLGDSEIYNVLTHYQEIGADSKRRLRVQKLKDIKNYRPSHILYVSKGYGEGVMEKLKHKPVMVIGEGFDCWQKNLHICMIKEGVKFRLKIDPISFEVSGLDLNPELIDLIKY